MHFFFFFFFGKPKEKLHLKGRSSQQKDFLVYFMLLINLKYDSSFNL